MINENYSLARGETRWANEEEIMSLTERVPLSEQYHPHAGLPILNDGSTAYVDDKDNHSLIFGSTGSKKTRLFCMPTLRIMIGAGESFVVTDPKGELYSRTSGAAAANGYDVVVLNYRDLDLGDTWNPLALPYELYQKGDKEGAISRLNDFVSAISEKSSDQTRDIFWVNASKSVALAILITMLDNCTKEECNLKTFTHFCTEFSKGTEDKMTAQAMGIDLDTLEKNYLTELMKLAPKDSVARLNYDGIAKLNDRARGDVQSTLFTLIGVFMSQEALVRNMRKTSFDMESLGSKKTALYLIVPDERTSYHFIATTFIKQCYETLIIKAQETGERVLPVRVNFVLDEFANIPAIPDMPSMISAARSRNIRFFLVLQSMHQLRRKYGEEAETIKGNCENWVFLSSKEIDLLGEISTLCGSVNSYVDGFTRTQPLISVSQLQRLNKQKGEALIFCGRQYPFITEMADIDDCDFTDFPPMPEKRIKQARVNGIDPETLYGEIQNSKRHLPFSEGYKDKPSPLYVMGDKPSILSHWQDEEEDDFLDYPDDDLADTEEQTSFDFDRFLYYSVNRPELYIPIDNLGVSKTGANKYCILIGHKPPNTLDSYKLFYDGGEYAMLIGEDEESQVFVFRFTENIKESLKQGVCDAYEVVIAFVGMDSSGYPNPTDMLAECKAEVHKTPKLMNYAGGFMEGLFKSGENTPKQTDSEFFIRQATEKGVHIAKSYDIYEAEDGDLMIALDGDPDVTPTGAKLYYDGKEQGLVVCDNWKVIVLTEVNEGARELLYNAGTVLMAFLGRDSDGEFDLEQLKEEFDAEVVQTPNTSFNADLIANLEDEI